MEVSETIPIPDISVVRPGMSEATSLGAAIAAGTAIGVWNKQVLGPEILLPMGCVK